MTMMMESDRVSSAESAGLQIKILMLKLMLCFSLLCGFGPLCVMRRAARCSSETGVRHRNLSLASCLSCGVFLSSCLLELLPDYLNDARQTFSRLGLALHFPLAEFILAMGFLVVFVVEQMLLAFREETGDVSHEKQALMDSHIQCHDKDALSRSQQRWRRLSWTDRSGCGEDGECHVGLRVFLLSFCVCVWALLEGLSVGSQQDPEGLLQACGALLLHNGIVAFGLAARLSQYGLRRGVAYGCLLLFSVTCPAGIGIGLALVGMNPSAQVQLVRCAVEGLTSGIFINVSVGGLLWQESCSPKHRVHKVAFLLTGFALVTAVQFSKV
ncbi:hypothetical protein ABG768_009368 [Culter alburnus]|uniref:Solute carrier family 39 member 1 n=1 Tax=Culter alburnus TaxID=194366 RepID=A0AAW1ZJA5_CULAL